MIIKVGSKFQRRTKRGTTHNLIVLHDSIKNTRVLYNVDLNVCQGTPILLYCHYVGDATKEELTKHQTAFNKKRLLNLEYAQKFLETNGWIRGEEGKVFVSYFPPPGLDLPNNYFIDVPKSEGKGFHNYMNQLIDILEDIYNGKLIENSDFNRHNKFVMSSNSMEKEEIPSINSPSIKPK